MTVEMDIVERKNEENLKHRTNIQKLILDENDSIPSCTPEESPPQTELQRFYGGKNVFITGGTGKSYRTNGQFNEHCILSMHAVNGKLENRERVMTLTKNREQKEKATANQPPHANDENYSYHTSNLFTRANQTKPCRFR